VTSPRKSALENYFHRDLQREQRWSAGQAWRGCFYACCHLLYSLSLWSSHGREASEMRCSMHEQQPETNHSPVILPDATIDAPQPVVSQLIAAFRHRPKRIHRYSDCEAVRNVTIRNACRGSGRGGYAFEQLTAHSFHRRKSKVRKMRLRTMVCSEDIF
jgi:hypothetical protein